MTMHTNGSSRWPLLRGAVTLLLACFVLLVNGCAVNPVTGERELHLVSTEQEIAIGGQQYLPARQAAGGDYILDAALADYVAEVGERLVAVSDRPQLPYQFTICNSSIPNAWALPGGKIAVNRGLLTELDNEAELAAVLAHEIVHSAARHGAKAMERGLLLQLGTVGVGWLAASDRYQDLIVGTALLGAQLVNQKYSREQELEADAYGMRYMARAGYDPQAAVTLQKKFVRLHEARSSSWLAGLFASHPPSAERVAANRASLQHLPPGGLVGADRYRARLARLLAQKPAYDAYDEATEVLAKNDLARAMRLVDRAIAIEPREALFYGLRGDIYLARNRPVLARREYDQAVERNPQYYRFYQQRGLVEWKLGQRQAARRDLEKAVALLPTAAAHYILGEILLAEGDTTAAADHFAAAAGSESTVGEAARLRLAVLDLRRDPHRFLVGSLVRAANGEGFFVLENRSPIVVRNVQLTVRLTTADGHLVNLRTLTDQGILRPGDTFRVRLLGTTAPEALARLQLDYRIVDFDILERIPEPL